MYFVFLFYVTWLVKVSSCFCLTLSIKIKLWFVNLSTLFSTQNQFSFFSLVSILKIKFFSLRLNNTFSLCYVYKVEFLLYFAEPNSNNTTHAHHQIVLLQTGELLNKEEKENTVCLKNSHDRCICVLIRSSQKSSWAMFLPMLLLLLLLHLLLLVLLANFGSRK